MAHLTGNIYEGQWLDGEKNGKGKYFDASIKLSYEGDWKNGKREGFGYLNIQGQSTYEGAFA
jgi:antitoxin component YwqK of YwqJK toxin-antitoxin module